MISQYVFRVCTQDPLPADRAYAFYSFLLSLLPDDYADELHQMSETPISQCLYTEKTEMMWKICLLDQKTIDMFSAALDELHTLILHTGKIEVEPLSKASISAEELIALTRTINTERYFSLRFLSPTAFRQNGRYTVLPEKELILQSLLKKWNTAFPSYPLEDEDAFRMILEGIRISDYHLHTTRFLLKDNRIPGFVGTMRIDTHLSAPLLEIWKMLIAFSEFSGIGIKTTLGMGGVRFLHRQNLDK